MNKEPDTFKGKRRWQNLVHKKCPNCSNPLEESGVGYKCIDTECGFFITIRKMLIFLGDKNGACYVNMNEREKSLVDSVLRELENEVK